MDEPYAIFRIREPAQEPFDIKVQRAGIIVGRHPNSDLVLKYKDVSHTHLQIIWHNGNFCVTDLDSSYGVFLNNERLAPSVPTTLTIGDLISVGPVKLTLEKIPGLQENVQEGIDLYNSADDDIGADNPSPEKPNTPNEGLLPTQTERSEALTDETHSAGKISKRLTPGSDRHDQPDLNMTLRARSPKQSQGHKRGSAKYLNQRSNDEVLHRVESEGNCGNHETTSAVSLHSAQESRNLRVTQKKAIGNLRVNTGSSQTTDLNYAEDKVKIDFENSQAFSKLQYFVLQWHVIFFLIIGIILGMLLMYSAIQLNIQREINSRTDTIIEKELSQENELLQQRLNGRAQQYFDLRSTSENSSYLEFARALWSISVSIDPMTLSGQIAAQRLYEIDNFASEEP